MMAKVMSRESSFISWLRREPFICLLFCVISMKVSDAAAAAVVVVVVIYGYFLS